MKYYPNARGDTHTHTYSCDMQAFSDYHESRSDLTRINIKIPSGCCFAEKSAYIYICIYAVSCVIPRYIYIGETSYFRGFRAREDPAALSTLRERRERDPIGITFGYGEKHTEGRWRERERVLRNYVINEIFHGR